MKQLDQHQVSISLSQGAVVPDSVLATTNLSELINRAASGTAGITFCSLETEDGITDFLSYQDLLIEAQKILRSLRKLGLQPQDQVILLVQNPRNFFASLWGCFLGGFVPIPLVIELNLKSQSDRLEQAWELCNSPLIITDIEQVEAFTNFEVVQFTVLLASEPDSQWHCGSLDDLALLLFTSGSTGKPKGVMLSGRNLIASMYGMAKVNQLNEQDITLNWMPVEHVASLVMFHLTEVYLGCEQIQVKSALILQNPLVWLDLLHQYRVTATWSPNFAYSLVNEQLKKPAQHSWDLSCLRWMGNGAEAVVGQTTQSFLELLSPYGLSPTVVSPGYGMSETCSGIAHSHDFYLNMDREFVSVGAPIPGVSLRIVNEDHEIVPEGEIGLLQVQGVTVTRGYYRQPELSQELFTADGWFNTGDLGFLQGGKLVITGRQKDVIIINGVNYYNHDLETVVEAIADITISYTAACAVKDRHQQEQIAIFFHTEQQEPGKLRKLVNSIRKCVFEQIGVTPAYLIPVAKETIPKTAIGKIGRSQLSERFASGEFDSIVVKMRELFDHRDLSQQELAGNGIERSLVEVWQSVLNLETISVKDNFFELGGNSLLLMRVLSQLTPVYSGLSAVTLFQYPTIADLAGYLNSDRESAAVQQGKHRGELRRQATGNRDVAIIGMSCRFPGANNLDQFWQNLCNGVESISWFEDQEILNSGVDADLVNHPDYVKASPILEDIEGFDADFWGYSPKEAQLLDPQQRLFMECAWESLEDAGYDPITYSGEISLYGGAATNTYLLNNIYPNRHTIDRQDDLQVVNLSSMGGFQVTTANDKDYLTTRTSYKLNLTGSSVNIQTACSTSLVTVHLACQSLINSEADIALAGGVSVHSPQKMGYLYQEGMILSPDGHCRAFDADAAGTIFGSGAGMVVLKLLDRAIADGDRIYGVIKGSAVNNDGGAKVGYLAPNVDGQTRVVAEALAFADIPPQSIGYIEAHGTGTKLGDPIEIAALTQAYQDHPDSGQIPPTSNICVGSVKTNVGHLQMASGIVGLIKTTLCLYHQKIAPSLHFNQPNPQIDFAHSPFYINTKLQDWKSERYPRRAGVNSLGIGGTNAHLILEEFVAEKEVIDNSLPAYLLTLSAKNTLALKDLISNYQDYLIKHNQVELRDICLTSNIGRHHFDDRLGIVASNKSELAAKLSELSEANIIKLQQNNRLAFLFTGQGSQYVGMGHQLYQTQAVFKSYCDRCWDLISSFGEISGTFLEFEFDINQTKYAQPLIFIIEYSLAQLWLSWGIKPEVMIGHSIGEYVAAAIAGVFSLEDALKLVVARGKLMQGLPNNGAMLAVFSSQDQIAFILEQNTLNINIAADNGSQIVLSGLQDDIDNIAKKLESRDIKVKLLDVSHAFHSYLMQPIIEEFKVIASAVAYDTPQIPIVSNVTGKLANETMATAEYWSNHILQPVQFAKSIEFLNQQQINIFLEIGTKPILTGIAASILDHKILLSSLDPQQEDGRQILETLSRLYIAGVDINWSEVVQEYSGKKVSLPTYPFQKQRYWFDLIPTDVYSQPTKNKRIHPLLGSPLSSPLKQTIFQSYLQPNTITWLTDHCLNNRAVFPGTAYIEIAIALGLFCYQSNQLVIEEIKIDTPLYIESVANHQELQIIVDPEQNSSTWQIYSRHNQEWQLHCTGKVSALNIPVESPSLTAIKAKFKHAELDIQQHYLFCEQRGINYGKSFRGIKQLWAKDNQALGLIELPHHLNSNEYHFHPALLDCCLQILFATLPTAGQTITYIPVSVDKLYVNSGSDYQVWSYLELEQQQYQNYQTLMANVYLYNNRGDLIAKIEGLKSQGINVNSQPDWHSWLYQQQWQQQPLAITDLAIKTGTWLIFADSTGIANKLVTLFKLQQQQCQVITSDMITNNAEAFHNLIQQYQKIAGAIYLGSLDSQNDLPECENYLYLVQALIQHHDHPPLWFITRNAQPINSYQLTSGIKHACLWGMQKAIALEHPELSCVGIDLDCNFSAHEAEDIFNEICSAESEQVGYRQNQRYVARLVRSKSRNQINNSVSKSESYSSENLQLEIDHRGNLSYLEWKPVSRLQPQANEIEIEVQATGLNFRDVMVALDLYPDETKFLGLECAGIVTKLGNGVTNFKLGDQVIAISDNSFSQYLTVDASLAITKPASLSYLEAATIPVTFLTAYYTLTQVAQLQPGEKVLIHAAAGGVGLAAIQIAQQRGAEVYATASTPKWSLLKSLGVTKIMNSRSLDFTAEIISATEGKGVDVVLNSLSGEFIPHSLAVLKDRGRFIEIGKQGVWSPQQIAQVKPNVSYAIVDLWQITRDHPKLIQQMLDELRSQFISEKLKPLPHKIFSREQTIEAFRYMQQGKHQGKIVISLETQIAQTIQDDLPLSPTPITFTGTYLITGGMGAIGLYIAEWLISQGVTNLVLLGRNGVKPELKNRLQKIQQECQLNLIKADVANTNQLAQALSQIESTLPPLRGVIHCAGIIDDRTIAKQDWSSFSKVLAPKVQGAWNLHYLTQKYDLESFILVSSAGSLIGSAGQANYCAANAFLDVLAHGRRSLGLPAIAINWSAWQNTGLASNSHTLGLEQKGVGSIKPLKAIKILEQLLLYSPTQIGVIPINWNVWQQHNFVTPFYHNIVAQSELEVESNIKQQLSTASITQARDLLINNISEQVANILGIKDIKQIDLDLGFSELGLDSLGSVELRNKLQSSYELKLSTTAIFDYSNINKLTNYILEIIYHSNGSSNNSSKHRDSIQIENLSELEAEALLLEELKNINL